MRQNMAWFFVFHSLSSFAFHSLSLLLYILLLIFTLIRPITSILFTAGWRLPHPTQLEPEPQAAVHSGRALPAEGLQHSHPLPGGDAGLRPRKRGQKDWRGKRKKERRGKSVGSGVAGWFFFIINWLFSLFYGLLRFSATWMRWFPIISTISCSS